MGEHCRVGASTNSPDFGTAAFRNYLITDLPLAPTKPIDAGMFKFCETCKICADLCPVSALSMDGPSYEGDPNISPSLLDVPFAYKGYRFNSYRCYKCSRCQTICPFTSKREAMVHSLVTGTISTTPIFNSFFTTMDKVFGYSEIRHPDDFWGNLPPMYGIPAAYNQ